MMLLFCCLYCCVCVVAVCFVALVWLVWFGLVCVVLFEYCFVFGVVVVLVVCAF